MKLHNMLLQCVLRLEVDWLADAVRADQPNLQEVVGYLLDDQVVVVGDQDLVAVEVQVSES